MTGSSRLDAVKAAVALELATRVSGKPRAGRLRGSWEADAGSAVVPALEAEAARLEMRFRRPDRTEWQPFGAAFDGFDGNRQAAVTLIADHIETPWEQMAAAAADALRRGHLVGMDAATAADHALDMAQRAAPGVPINPSARGGLKDEFEKAAESENPPWKHLGSRLPEYFLDHDPGWAADQPWAVRARRELAAEYLERAEPGELGDEVKDAVVEWIEGWLREGWEGATRRETLQTGGIARAGQLFADLRSSVTAHLTGDRATARPANGWAFRLTRLLADDPHLRPRGAVHASAVWAEMPGAAPATGATSSAAGWPSSVRSSSARPEDRGRDSR